MNNQADWPIEVGAIYEWKESERGRADRVAYRVLRAIGDDRYEIVHHWIVGGKEFGHMDVMGDTVRERCHPPDLSEIPGLRKRVGEWEAVGKAIMEYAGELPASLDFELRRLLAAVLGGEVTQC